MSQKRIPEDDQIKRDWMLGSHNVEDLAERYDIAPAYMRTILRRLGFKPPDKRNQPPRKRQNG